MNAATLPRTRRRGIITVAALVCLIIVAMICGALLKIDTSERRVVRMEERRLQAEWLVEAGLQRAGARLASNDHYQGETWTCSAEDLGGNDPGLVTIAVETPKDQPARRAVHVRAECPAGSTLVVRRSKQVVLDVAEKKEKETEKKDKGGEP